MNARAANAELPQLAGPLGEFLSGLADAHKDLVRTTVESLVLAESEGHACVVLEDALERDALLRSGVAGIPGQILPLILEGDRVYLRRMFISEGAVAQALKARMAADSLSVDAVQVGAFLRRCGLLGGAGIDWQAVAVVAGLVRPLVVVSGGPGTGKTRTAAVLVAAIQRFQPSERVALAAPTGKAAARLSESISSTLATLGCAPAEPLTASTLHRLLGASADGKRFRFGPANPLPADVVIVDEASMVDLAMMGRLVAALRPDARLVLLGDKDQLASVEAGYVLGDLCEAAGLNRFTGNFASLIEEVTGTRPESAGGAEDTAVELQNNFRFGSGNAIETLSTLVRGGEAAGSLDALSGFGPNDEVRWEKAHKAAELEEILERACDHSLRCRWDTAQPGEALEAMGRFQILCAIKKGPFGRDAVNDAVEQMLETRKLRQRGQAWYRGRPILISANAPQLNLFNGDMGVAWQDEAGVLQVWFAGPDGPRAIPLGRLPSHETAFAMTVHKSQGSEFDEVVLILPPSDTPVCTRELVYTGITRARKRVTLIAGPTVLKEAVARGSQRTSGLKERLGAPAL